MKKEFQLIRQNLEEHLLAINENTLEIQALLDYLQEMEVKIEKLAQRLDSLQLSNPGFEKPVIQPLNKMEERIFFVFYTEEKPLTFTELTMKTKLPRALIADCVSSLVQKGIPLQRSSFNDQLFFKLDRNFKELQAKENLVNLSLHSFLE